MLKAKAYERALRALGTGVLAVFLVGSASGPLRTCLNHPGHAAGDHGVEYSAVSHVAEHVADHSGHETTEPVDHGPATDHEGCSCLGRCSLEHAPSLLGSLGPSLAHTPAAPKAIAASAVQDFVRQDPFDLPLARPPPAVV